MRRDQDGEESFGIHEVYYEEGEDDTRVCGWTENPTEVVCEDMEGLRWHLERMAEALGKPVLDYDKHPRTDYWERIASGPTYTQEEFDRIVEERKK